MLNSYSQSGKVSSNHLRLSSHNCRQHGNLMQIAAERLKLQLDLTQVRISLGIKNESRPGHIWRSNHLLHNRQQPTIKHALYSLHRDYNTILQWLFRVQQPINIMEPLKKCSNRSWMCVIISYMMMMKMANKRSTEKRVGKNIFHSFDFFHFSPLSVQLPTTMLVHLCDGFKFMAERV